MKKKMTFINAVVLFAFTGSVLFSSCAFLSSAPSPAERLRETFQHQGPIQPLALPDSCPQEVEKGWIVGKRSDPVGYGLQVRNKTRSGYFVALIGLDSQFRIESVDLISYVGERGSEISQEEFREQFVGKGAGDPFQVGDDIDAVTGATISSKSMTTAIGKSVRWLRDCLSSNFEQKCDPASAFSSQQHQARSARGTKLLYAGSMFLGNAKLFSLVSARGPCCPALRRFYAVNPTG